MTPSPPRLRHRTRTASRRAALALSMVLVLVATHVVGASAALLGGVSAKTQSAFAFSASSGAPTVLAWENFDGANGASLNGTVTDGGARTWALKRSGSWSIQANRAQPNANDTALVVNPGVADATQEAVITRSTGTSWDIGLVAYMNTAGTEFVTAEWTSNANGALELWKFAGNGWTLLAQQTGLYPGGVATAPARSSLRLASVGSSLVATLAGSTVVSHTLTPAEQTLYRNTMHPFFGLYSYYDGASSLDDWHLDV